MADARRWGPTTRRSDIAVGKPRLFHVGDAPGVTRFEPRPSPTPHPAVDRPCVWAVDDSHVVNYLTPRHCPRITFRAGPDTAAADIERFLLGARRVVAIEAAWLDRLNAGALSIYELPPERFDLIDANAGYWISYVAVGPIRETRRTNLLAALIAAGVEVRLLQDFRGLADAVAASTLEFSIIRKHNVAN